MERSGINFFFLKHKTAYEMSISDWSSDVCSADLGEFRGLRADQGRAAHPGGIAGARSWAQGRACRLSHYRCGNRPALAARTPARQARRLLHFADVDRRRHLPPPAPSARRLVVPCSGPPVCPPLVSFCPNPTPPPSPPPT